MSSTNSNPNEPGAAQRPSSPWRSPAALALFTIGLLAALVLAMKPSAPRLVPAPLRPPPAGCPKAPPEFTPSNYTAIPGLPLDTASEKDKNRALLRLNFEPCTCGCGVSLAACRNSNPACETSKVECRKVADEETSGTKR